MLHECSYLKSVRNRCFIKVFGGIFVLQPFPLPQFSVGLGILSWNLVRSPFFSANALSKSARGGGGGGLRVSFLVLSAKSNHLSNRYSQNIPCTVFTDLLIMTQLISFSHFFLTAVRTGRFGVLPIKIYRGNNAVFVSVDFIGEKNQVILELCLMHSLLYVLSIII